MGLKSSGGTPLRVQIRLGFPTTNDASPPFARLEVIDQASHLTFLEVELDADAFMRLMSNQSAYADAALCKYLGRIGKEMQHESHDLPGAAFKDQADADAAGRSWADDNDWETVTVHKAHNHWHMTGRRWVTPEAAS